MKWTHLAAGFAAASAATLVYGALVEANRLVVERRRLRLANWPERLRGYKIAFLTDFHVRDGYSMELARRAVAAALDASPDMVLLGGDFVAYWKPESARQLGEVLEPLLLMQGNVAAVPGNHEYWMGGPDLLAPICEELNIRLLRNEVWRHHGIVWAGIDSANAEQDDAEATMSQARALASANEPVVALWHEPDPVDRLPRGASLMLSGHSHGGQFTFPWGWTPMHTDNGRKYVRGFYPDAPTPIYVSRGIGTTGYPSRLGCPPEVAILMLDPL